MARADAKYSVSLEDKTAATIRRLRGNLSGIDKSFAGISKGVAGLGAAVGVGGLTFLAKQSIDAADQIGKLSIRLGASTEALSEYRHVAEISGIQFETLTMGFQRMTRRIAEAAQGTGEARGALAELNLDASALSQIAPEQQFEAIADAIFGLGKQSDRVRLAMKLFDSEGVALVQTMGNGAQGIKEMREEARRLGLTLSKDQTDAAAAANDELTRLNAVFSGLSQTFATNLAGPLADLLKYFNEGIPTAVNYTKAAYASLAYVVVRLREGLNVISFDFEEAEQLGRAADDLYALYRASLKAAEGAKPLQDRVEQLSGAADDLSQRISNAESRIESYGDVRPGDQFYDRVQQDRMLIEALTGDLHRVREQLQLAKRDLDAFGNNTTKTGSVETPDIKTVQAPEVDAQLVQQLAEIDRMLDTSAQTQMAKLHDQYLNRQFIIDQALDSELISYERHQQLLLDNETRYQQERAALLQEGVELTNNLRGRAIGELGTLLNTLAGESKDAARAAIVLQKAMAIAQIRVDTEKAAMAGYAYGMAFGGPTMAESLAARARMWGNISTGLVAATGLAQLSQINSGGGGGGSGSNAGSAANPISTVPALGSQQQGSERQLTIVIDTGGSGLAVMSERQLDEIIVGAVQRADDRGVTIIRPNGSNAQAVRSGF